MSTKNFITVQRIMFVARVVNCITDRLFHWLLAGQVTSIAEHFLTFWCLDMLASAIPTSWPKPASNNNDKLTSDIYPSTVELRPEHSPCCQSGRWTCTGHSSSWHILKPAVQAKTMLIDWPMDPYAEVAWSQLHIGYVPDERVNSISSASKNCYLAPKNVLHAVQIEQVLPAAPNMCLSGQKFKKSALFIQSQSHKHRPWSSKPNTAN